MLKNETLASQPELNSKAEGEVKNRVKRDSREVCEGEEPDRRREPVDPRT